MCLLGEYDNPQIVQLVSILNNYNFERIENDLSYNEFLQISDIYKALKFEGPLNAQITNKQLEMSVNNGDLELSIRYEESGSHFDPFKKRVVQGLSKGLTEASIDH